MWLQGQYSKVNKQRCCCQLQKQPENQQMMIWLGKSNSLGHFWSIRKIAAFSKQVKSFAGGFLFGCLLHLNELNLKQQGQNNSVHYNPICFP